MNAFVSPAPVLVGTEAVDAGADSRGLGESADVPEGHF